MVRVSRASPLQVLMVVIWIPPLVWAAARSPWFMTPILAMVIGVMLWIFVIPAATDRFVRIEPSRDLLELERRLLGMKVRTTRHALTRAKSVEFHRHESEEEADTFMITLYFERGEHVELAYREGGGIEVQSEMEAAARTLNAYLFPPE